MALLTSLLYLFILSAIKGKWQKLLLIVIPFVALINNYSYFHPGTIVDHEDSYYLRRYLPQESLLPEEKVSADYLNYTENYLPLPVAAVRPTVFPKNVITSSQPETVITFEQTNPFSTKALVHSHSGDFITIHRFFYPGWVVKLDGSITKITLDKNGAMKFFVNKGDHVLDLSFKDTNIRYAGNIVSVVMFTASVLILIYYSSRKRDRSK